MRPFSITLQPNEARIVQASGKILSVKTCDAPLIVAFNSGAPETVKAGDVLPFDGQIKTLNFVNPNATAVSIYFFVGDEAVKFLQQDQSTAVVQLPPAAQANLGTLIKTANTGSAVQFTGTPTYFQWAAITAFRDGSRTPNNDIVYIGSNSAQVIPLSPGDIFYVPIPQNKEVDFRNWYLSVANNGDGVVVLFF